MNDDYCDKCRETGGWIEVAYTDPWGQPARGMKRCPCRKPFAEAQARRMARQLKVRNEQAGAALLPGMEGKTR